MLTSTRCVYIPGIVGWLNRWKQILTHANNCFKTIQTTGDGSPGVCQEFIAVYVCDFVFDMARCFTQKYSEGGAIGSVGELSSGGIGDILHAITKGTTVTQQRMRSRYGETAVFKSLFVERKLQHAMCAAAFGLPYDLDVESIYKQSIPEIPIPSQAMLFPCKRRFAGYNPITIQGQKGLTTWIYETTAFVAPGSDLRWWLELKCSTGYKCESKDGFKNGECDCNKLGQEKIMTVRPQETPKDTLLKDEILDQKLTYVVQASDNSDNSKVRYDRAVLRWESTDPKVKSEMKTGQAECYIPLTGGDAPAFCSFDPIAGSYLCKFGQQQGSIEIKDAKPIPEKFYLGQTPSFTVTINQNYPSEIRNKPEENKFLSWELKNEVGEIKAKGDNTPLTTDGTYPVPVDTRYLINKDESFAKTTAEDSFTVTAKGRIINTNFRQYLRAVKMFDVNGIDFGKNKRTVSIKFYKSVNEFKFKREGVKEISGERVEYDLSDDTYEIISYDNENNRNIKTVKFTITNSQAIKDLINSQEDLSVTINNQEPEKIEPCQDPKSTKQWTIVFKVLDADKTGEATNRVSVNPKTAQPVERPVGFEVVCGEATAGRGSSGASPISVYDEASQILSSIRNPSSITFEIGTNKYIVTAQESIQLINNGAPSIITPPGTAILDKARHVFSNLDKTANGIVIISDNDKYIIGLDNSGNVESYMSRNGAAPEKI